MKAVSHSSAKCAQRATDRLCKAIAALARDHALGTVGLAGSWARCEADPTDDIDVVVQDLSDREKAFGTALSLATDRSIHLHLLDGLPWHHPYHLCIRWLNCDRLPIVCVPRGATICRQQSDSGLCRTRIALSAIPHFVEIDTPPAASPHVVTTFIVAPPLGGFLL